MSPYDEQDAGPPIRSWTGTTEVRAGDLLRSRDRLELFRELLNETLSCMADPVLVEGEACRLLGIELGTDRTYFVTFYEEAGYASVTRDYVRDGLPSLVSRYPLSSFRFMVPLYRSGQVIVVEDVRHWDRVPAKGREEAAHAGVVAWIAVPLLRGGRLVGALCATSQQPRQWTEEETGLLLESASQLWADLERSRAEASQRESEHRFRSVLEGIPQLVWRSQDGGRWTWVSPQWQSFTGQAQDESHGLGWLRALHPDDRAHALEAWHGAEYRGSLDVEYRIRRAVDGTYVWHHTRSVPVRDGKGDVVEWLGTCTDIEATKRTNTELRESEERFRLFVENVREYALVQTDPHGVVTSWNPGAERLFGYTRSEIVGQSFTRLLPMDDREDGILARELSLLAQGKKNVQAHFVQRKDGSQFWAEWVTEPVFDDTGKLRGTAKVMRDESEREAAALTIRKSLAEKEELLKEVHHRVKNNLQVITSLINLQARQVAEPGVRHMLDETRNRILSIASIHERLYQSANFSEINLLDYARHIVPELVTFYGVTERVQAEIRGGEVLLELARAVPFGLLLNELVSNALKHAFPRSREGLIRVTINYVGQRIHAMIEDDGVGLPAQFDPGQTSSLGIRLSRTLARQIGGELQFHSGVEVGTTIEVTLPFSVDSPGSSRKEGDHV